MPLTISLVPRLLAPDARRAINAVAYDEIPPWHTILDKLTITYSTIRNVFDIRNIDLVAFSNWHSSFGSTIFSTTMPSSYRYTFDGGQPNSISDGGNDMFDGGNVLGISGISSISSINYGTLRNNIPTGAGRGFFISPANQWPNVMMAYVQSGTIGLANWGNTGTDFGGTTSSLFGTYTTANGRSGNYWVNQNYGAVDPSIIYAYFNVDTPEYTTTITSSNVRFETSDRDTYTQNINLTGSNIIFFMTLLSIRRTFAPTGGYFVSRPIIEGFISSYVFSAQLNIS